MNKVNTRDYRSGRKGKSASVIVMLWLTVFAGLVLFARWNEGVKKNDVQKYIDRGRDYMGREMYVEALQELNSAETKKKSIESAEMIAECYLKLGDYTSFEAQMESIEELYGLTENLYIDKAYYYSELSDVTGEIKALSEGLEKYPESAAIKQMYDDVKGTYTLAGYYEDDVYGMVDDHFVVCSEEGTSVLTSSMNSVGNTKFDKVFDVSMDSCIADNWTETSLIISAMKDGEAVYYDENGYKRRAPSDDYSYIGAPRDGYILVEKGDAWGYVDMKFKERDNWYDEATSFSGGIAAVKKAGKWAFIDTDFKQITDFVYEDVAMDDVRRCSVSGIAFGMREGAYVMVDRHGELRSKKSGEDRRYDDVRVFAEADGYAACHRDGAWYLVSSVGEECERVDCDDVMSTSNGIAAFKKAGKWGYIAVGDGEYANGAWHDAGSVNSKGFAPVKEDDGWSFIQFAKLGSD